VLLIVLWVRSFWHLDGYAVPVGRVNYVAQSLRGSIVLDWSAGKYTILSGYWSVPASIASVSDDIPGATWRFLCLRLTKLPNEIALVMSMWFGLVVTVGIATTPWLRWRFGLRILFIVTTFIAVLLGLVVWAMQ
jgi:hypothetical protein